jgi:hypothetical protein
VRHVAWGMKYNDWYSVVKSMICYFIRIFWRKETCYSAFGKSLRTYKRCWKWCPRASIQAWTRLILLTNTICWSACEMFLMYAVIAVCNSLCVRGRSRYTADFAAAHRWNSGGLRSGKRGDRKFLVMTHSPKSHS